ncbi:MAG: J domain-containing protein [Candidatus Lambdaproteobacteria bacterium]|nr:J domain-containing protein [Candidatus Lambdaproteobacteria bacterium]
MRFAAQLRFSRVFGDESVLARLAMLGRTTRTFRNLVRGGFPEGQLDDARAAYAKAAATPVERYAARRMAEDFFEDESLLQVFCRYYECTDWRLESSPWFFSKEEYRRFFEALLSPLAFQVAQLERGYGEERWGSYFLRLPFDLGMEQARRALWDDVCQRDFYWREQRDYGHLRAAMLFGHLSKVIDAGRLDRDQYAYHWEREFRVRLHAVLRSFEEALERNVRVWQEQRQERTARRFRFQSFGPGGEPTLRLEVLQAFAALGLEPATATFDGVKSAFRLLSKQAHPDQGGSDEAFQRLAACKELVEGWLRDRARG